MACVATVDGDALDLLVIVLDLVFPFCVVVFDTAGGDGAARVASTGVDELHPMVLR